MLPAAQVTWVGDPPPSAFPAPPAHKLFLGGRRFMCRHHPLSRSAAWPSGLFPGWLLPFQKDTETVFPSYMKHDSNAFLRAPAALIYILNTSENFKGQGGKKNGCKKGDRKKGTNTDQEKDTISDSNSGDQTENTIAGSSTFLPEGPLSHWWPLRLPLQAPQRWPLGPPCGQGAALVGGWGAPEILVSLQTRKY